MDEEGFVEIEELVAGVVVGDGGIGGSEMIGHDEILVDDGLLRADDADLVLSHEVVRGGGMNVLLRIDHQTRNILSRVI